MFRHRLVRGFWQAFGKDGIAKLLVHRFGGILLKVCDRVGGKLQHDRIIHAHNWVALVQGEAHGVDGTTLYWGVGGQDQRDREFCSYVSGTANEVCGHCRLLIVVDRCWWLFVAFGCLWSVMMIFVYWFFILFCESAIHACFNLSKTFDFRDSIV